MSAHYFNHENVHGWTKLHTRPVNWATAKANCLNEGTHNSDNEILPGEIVITDGNALEDAGFYGEGESFTEEVLNDNRTSLETSSNETSSSIKTILPHDYALDPRTGHCYKLYNDGKAWNKSREVCRNDGGDLVVMNSLEEAKFVKKIYAKCNFFIDTTHSSEMFVGIYEKEIYSWKTIDGETLNKAGFAEWAAGKPGGRPYDWPEHMKDIRRACGTIDKQGRYNDCWCEYAYGHTRICEKLAADTVC